MGTEEGVGWETYLRQILKNLHWQVLEAKKRERTSVCELGSLYTLVLEGRMDLGWECMEMMIHF
jgi:hypothetical protein